MKSIDVKPLELYHRPFMLDPNLIDPEIFADEKQQLQGSYSLKKLDKRVWLHEYLANHDAVIDYTLQGGRDKWQRLFLNLSVTSTFQLVCQRCVKPMPFKLHESAHIILFVDEQSLDEAMLSDDDLEGLLLTKELDVRTLVEDQVLMALPFAPRHEDCDNVALAEVNQDKPNPFAVLAGLKNSR